MISHLRAAVAAVALWAVAAPAFAYDPAPWIEDLRQIRAALDTRYPNLEWQTVERGLNLDASFKAAEAALSRQSSDADAKALIDRAVASLADGHLLVNWTPQPRASGGAAAPRLPCADLRAPRVRAPIAAAFADWAPVDGEGAREFPGGVVTVEGRKVGVVQIGLFEADQVVCQAAAAQLKLPMDKPCEGECWSKLDTAVYQFFTDRFAARLESLKAAGAQVLMVDLAGNGGGREWAEVAVRMVTPIRLKSAPVRLIRSPQAAEQLEGRALDIEANVKAERGALKADLLRQAADLRTHAVEARRPCEADKPCARLINAGYGSGVWASADPKALADKPWGQSVFEPMKWRWSEGVWSGPLIVLVDGRTGSASEEFSAVLQDNRAAIILGAPSAGSGCGHATEAGPVTLKNSGGRLFLPDCLRLRADGSNEIGGIDPDVLVGFRMTDGAALKAKRLAVRLPDAVSRAVALAGR